MTDKSRPDHLQRARFRGRTVRRAFTILELLIVIAILLAIGGIVLINVLGAQDRADIGVTKVQMQSLEDALMRFKADMKRYPSEEEGVVDDITIVVVAFREG